MITDTIKKAINDIAQKKEMTIQEKIACTVEISQELNDLATALLKQLKKEKK